jgi:hypothetical protein
LLRLECSDELWFNKGTFDDSKEFREMDVDSMANETKLHYVGYEQDSCSLNAWSIRYVQQYDETIWLDIGVNSFGDLYVRIY